MHTSWKYAYFKQYVTVSSMFSIQEKFDIHVLTCVYLLLNPYFFEIVAPKISGRILESYLCRGVCTETDYQNNELQIFDPGNKRYPELPRIQPIRTAPGWTDGHQHCHLPYPGQPGVYKERDHQRLLPDQEVAR